MDFGKDLERAKNEDNFGYGTVQAYDTEDREVHCSLGLHRGETIGSSQLPLHVP